MHGQYLSDMDDKDEVDTWKWLQKSDLKCCPEALIRSAQEQALQANYTKFSIDKKNTNSPLCRTSSNEMVLHVSEYSMLAQREYKRRHNNIAKCIHWRLCEKIRP